MTQVWTFTAQGTPADVQAAISDNDGHLILTVPWQHTRGYEDVTPGDGAVIEVADQADRTCWIGDVLDAECEPGYPLTVMVGIR